MRQLHKPLTLALSRRERGLIGVFVRGTPIWDTELNSGDEKHKKNGTHRLRNASASQAPHPSPLPEGEGTDRGVWEKDSDVK